MDNDRLLPHRVPHPVGAADVRCQDTDYLQRRGPETPIDTYEVAVTEGGWFRQFLARGPLSAGTPGSTTMRPTTPGVAHGWAESGAGRVPPGVRGSAEDAGGMTAVTTNEEHEISRYGATN